MNFILVETKKKLRTIRLKMNFIKRNISFSYVAPCSKDMISYAAIDNIFFS